MSTLLLVGLGSERGQDGDPVSSGGTACYRERGVWRCHNLAFNSATLWSSFETLIASVFSSYLPSGQCHPLPQWKQQQQAWQLIFFFSTSARLELAFWHSHWLQVAVLVHLWASLR
eukprot:836414-Amphidinium_carterae.1